MRTHHDQIRFAGLGFLAYGVKGMAHLADRARLPHTVVLALVGTLIGLAAVLLVDHGRELLGLPLAAELFEFNIRASVFLRVLLSTLLFQISLGPVRAARV